ncbi:hypothetical protein [Microcoleus sp. FACHB-68]|nr:hypothetical protein [Microcoleus sp. FACHB-68]MBD1937791.1 hypothetical protein [Microcoleus sp. FACHB-68]
MGHGALGMGQGFANLKVWALGIGHGKKARCANALLLQNWDTALETGN